MLLRELYIFEATDFATTIASWIQPSTGKVVDSGRQHLQAILNHPEQFNIDQKVIDQDFATNQYIDVQQFVRANDFVSGRYHMMAYNNGWVRWRANPGMNFLGLSGILQPLLQFMSSKPLIQYVKEQLTSQGPFRMLVDVIEPRQQEEFSFEWEITSLSTYHEFRREVEQEGSLVG